MRTSLEYVSRIQGPSRDISVGTINLVQTTIPKVEYMGTDVRSLALVMGKNIRANSHLTASNFSVKGELALEARSEKQLLECL